MYFNGWDLELFLSAVLWNKGLDAVLLVLLQRHCFSCCFLLIFLKMRPCWNVLSLELFFLPCFPKCFNVLSKDLYSKESFSSSLPLLCWDGFAQLFSCSNCDTSKKCIVVIVVLICNTGTQATQCVSLGYVFTSKHSSIGPVLLTSMVLCSADMEVIIAVSLAAKAIRLCLHRTV